MDASVNIHVLSISTAANLSEGIESLLTATGNHFKMLLKGPRNISDPKVAALQEILDVSPIRLKEIRISGGLLIPKSPFVFRPQLDREHSRLVVRDSLLNIDAWGHDPYELIEAVEIELDVLWRIYALADDSTLTLDAIAVKNALNRQFRFQ